MAGPSTSSTSSTGSTSVSKTSGLLTEKEREEKKLQEEQAERAAEEKARHDKEPALGPLAGGRLKAGTFGTSAYLAEVYTGIGALAVPCTRGEQKALTGDTLVKLTIDNEDREDVDDVEIIFIIPKEAADAILGSAPPELTNADYDSIVSEKSARATRKKLVREGRSPRTAPPTASTRPANPSSLR